MLKNRILYTGSFRFPEGDAAAARVLGNAKLLRELGCSVYFAGWESRENKKDNVNRTFFYQEFQYESMGEFRNIEMSLIGRLFSFFCQGNKTIYWLKNNIDKFDYIFLYNPSFIFFYKMYRFSLKMKKPIVLDVTEWYDNSHLPGGRFGPVALDNTLKMKYAFKKAKNLILISSYLEKYYKDTSVNIIVLPPLIDKDDSKWANAIISDSQEIRLLYAGSPGKKDLLLIVVNAVKEAINCGIKVKFNVVGISYEQYLKLGGEEVEHNYSGLIIFNGKVPQNKVPLFYKDADFSVIIRPLKRFAMAGFPTKLVESQILGVPVIANTTSDIHFYIKNEFNGILIEGEATKEKILDVIFKISKLDKSSISKMKFYAKQSALNSFHYGVKKVEMSKFLEKIK